MLHAFCFSRRRRLRIAAAWLPPWLRIGRKFSFLADLEHFQATAQASLRTSKAVFRAAPAKSMQH
jgi:hypothetical protein